ncbi:MAG: inorganic diphosphatase, partial [Guyparkeria sp.]
MVFQILVAVNFADRIRDRDSGWPAKNGIITKTPRLAARSLFLQFNRNPFEADPMDLSKIPAGKNPPEDINVVIEIPVQGVPVKYELDKDSGALLVDRFMATSMYYPTNYGFI